MRPWQHVLSPLGGYLLLAEALAAASDLRASAARAWNFGPAGRGRAAGELDRASGSPSCGRASCSWELDERENPPEAGHLALDSSAAETLLGWRPRWSLADALELVVDWHRATATGRTCAA